MKNEQKAIENGAESEQISFNEVKQIPETSGFFGAAETPPFENVAVASVSEGASK